MIDLPSLKNRKILLVGKPSECTVYTLNLLCFTNFYTVCTESTVRSHQPATHRYIVLHQKLIIMYHSDNLFFTRVTEEQPGTNEFTSHVRGTSTYPRLQSCYTHK